MNQNRTQNPLLLGFLILSLILHLLLVYLAPGISLFPTPPKKDRVVVELRPEPQLRERELDLQPQPELDKPREKPAKRLGAANQVVEKETAPKGEAFEDMRPDAPHPQAQRNLPKLITPAPRPVEPDIQRRQADTGPKASEKTPEETAPVPAVPELDLKSLLQLPDTTMARLENSWRQKYRDKVAEGDVVWLDTEQDLLFSFFQRLRNNIYNVWSYPRPAAEHGDAGACLVRITVNRSGDLTRSPELLETSGFPVLDREALAAVRKGSPYGPLPASYEKETLTIMAVFRYELSGIGSRRPGRIY